MKPGSAARRGVSGHGGGCGGPGADLGAGRGRAPSTAPTSPPGTCGAAQPWWWRPSGLPGRTRIEGVRIYRPGLCFSGRNAERSGSTNCVRNVDVGPQMIKKAALKGKNNLQSKPKDDRINLCNSIEYYLCSRGKRRARPHGDPYCLTEEQDYGFDARRRTGRKRYHDQSGRRGAAAAATPSTGWWPTDCRVWSFIALNTDQQALTKTPCDGQGAAGLQTDQGPAAPAQTPKWASGPPRRARTRFANVLKGAQMVLITAGMGGGNRHRCSPCGG